MAAFKEEQRQFELEHGIVRGPDGKLKLPPGSPPPRGPHGELIPGGAVVRGPDGKILRIISASGLVRGPDGKLISFSVPVKKPTPKATGFMLDASCFRGPPARSCCPMKSSCTYRSVSVCSNRY